MTFTLSKFNASQVNASSIVDTKDNQPLFAWIQPNMYKDTIDEDMFWVISNESAKILPQDSKIDIVSSETAKVKFGSKKIDVNKVADVKFVVLSRPVIMAFHPDDKNKVFPQEYKSGWLRENGYKTTAKLLLGVVKDGVLLKDGDKPVIVTLRLNGLNTNVVGGKHRPEDNSIFNLNIALNDAIQQANPDAKRGWATHIAAIDLKPVPREHGSQNGKSWGYEVAIGQDIQPLSTADQVFVSNFLRNDEIFKQFSKNPYEVPQALKQNVEVEVDFAGNPMSFTPGAVIDEEDDIPFD